MSTDGSAPSRSIAAGALLSLSLRAAYAASPIALRWFDERTGAIVMVAASGALQLVGTLVAHARERRATEGLYAAVAARLVDVDAMRPLPLPSIDPEIAVARGLRARARLFATVTPGLLGEGAAGAIGCALLLASGLRAAVLPLLLGALLAAPSYLLLQRRARRHQDGAHAAWVALYTHLSTFLRERQERLACGGRDSFLADLDSKLADERASSLRATIWGALLRRVPLAVAATAAASVVALGALSIPMTLTTAWLLGCLLSTAAAFAGALTERVVLSSDARELDLLLELVPRPPQGGVEPGPCRSLEAAGVSFAYDGGAVFAPVSFVAAPGRMIVLRGPNGGGKSTLLRLLAGLGAPTEGELTVDGVPLGRMALDAYRRRVAFVPQSTSLDARATVREVMTVAGPLDDEALAAALVAAGFDAPRDLLLERVGPLSAGRKRRVQLARALAMGRDVLLLDEPEAGLDEASSRALLSHLRALSEQRIVVVATHARDLVGESVVLERPS